MFPIGFVDQRESAEFRDKRDLKCWFNLIISLFLPNWPSFPLIFVLKFRILKVKFQVYPIVQVKDIIEMDAYVEL